MYENSPNFMKDKSATPTHTLPQFAQGNQHGGCHVTCIRLPQVFFFLLLFCVSCSFFFFFFGVGPPTAYHGHELTGDGTVCLNVTHLCS